MPGTILIVDDHSTMRETLHMWLQTEFPQCEIIEAASGEGAIAISQLKALDVILMDIDLVIMNGIEATRRIKASTPAVHIVILTIHEEEVYRADAMAAGADAFVAKRTMRTELIPLLASFLSNNGATESEL